MDGFIVAIVLLSIPVILFFAILYFIIKSAVTNGINASYLFTDKERAEKEDNPRGFNAFDDIQTGKNSPENKPSDSSIKPESEV